MRNALLLVALFLGGMTTQAIAQHREDVNRRNGDKHRYYNTQEIRFVENGVLFTVATDGTFSFTSAYGQPYNNYRRGAQNRRYIKDGRNGRRVHRPRIKRDYFGNIIGINNICIFYKRNGKVKQIGSVPLYYNRGYLTQIGGMTIKYNRFGDIRDTYGYINRRNRNVWHNDWYTYNGHGNDWNDDWNDDWSDVENWDGRRIRSEE